jgi:hypothetical protein
MELEVGIYHQVSVTVPSKHSDNSPISRPQVSIVSSPIRYLIDIRESAIDTVSWVRVHIES